MEEPIKATFWHIGNVIYRNETKIIFNKDNEIEEELPCIGIILMLNPGSCLPKKGEKPIEEEKQVLLCKPDLTIKKVEESIRCAYDRYYNKLNGYVFIVNLCDKKEKSKGLIKKDFEETDGKDKDAVKEIENKMNEPPKQVDWIWIGFGKNSYGKDKEYVDNLKKDILKQLNEKYKDKIVGGNSDYNCTHPQRFQFDKNKQKIIIKEIESKL